MTVQSVAPDTQKSKKNGRSFPARPNSLIHSISKSNNKTAIATFSKSGEDIVTRLIGTTLKVEEIETC